MTSGQKIAFSLLAALALFAGFVLSFHSTLFKELETRFYTQAKIEENTGQLDKISESCDSYISEILSLVEKGENAWTKNASVRTYYVQNPSESDVNVRRRLTENLFAQIPALTGIRIVDKNGRNVHYTSFDDTDLLKQNGITKIYKNYNDITKDASEIPFETLEKVTDETKSVLLCDQNRGRLILSVPFCWVDGIYSGLCLFYLNIHEVEKELIARDVISFGQGMTLFSDDDMNGGLLLNLPYGHKSEFKTPVLSYWKSPSQQPEKLLELPDGRFYVALSSNRIGKIRVSALYTSDIFELSQQNRILIYVCVFISILLIVFLFFSFFRDPLVTLQKRIKKIQLGIIENFLDGKEKKEWGDLARQLRLRRNDLSEEIIKSLHLHSKKRRKELSEYLDKNWEEIFAIFDTKTRESSENVSGAAQKTVVTGSAEISGASIAEIRRMLEEVLQNRAVGVNVAPVAAVTKPAPVVDELDEVEELDDVEDIEEAEEVEELAEEVEDVEEVEELTEEVDDAEEVEELTEEVEDAEEVEELTEDVEDAEEVEELAEEVDEVEELDDAEEVEELDDDEDVEDAEAVEELDDAEEVEELAEEVEDIDEVEELAEEIEEPAEEIEELAEDAEEPSEEIEEQAEEVEDAEEVDELDDAEDIENLAEEVEDLEVLDEYVETPASEKYDASTIFAGMSTPQKDYEPSNDTYFASENFANVDNLFAEELCLGDERIKINTSPIPFTIFELPGYIPSSTDEEELFVPVDDLFGDNEPLIASVEDLIDVDIIEDDSTDLVKSDNGLEFEEVDEVENIEKIEEPAETSEDSVEDLLEEVPSLLTPPEFTMTRFADNIDKEVPELESALTVPDASEDTIIEKDGVYTISENLEYTNIIQDPEFKELVDSIL